MRGYEHLNPPPELLAVARHVQDLVATAYTRELRTLDPATHDELAVAILVDHALAAPGTQHAAADQALEQALEHAPISTRRALSRLTDAFPDTRPVGFGSATSAAGILLRRDGDRMIAAGHGTTERPLFRNAVRVDGHVFWVDGTNGIVSLDSGLHSGVYATGTSTALDRNADRTPDRSRGISI